MDTVKFLIRIAAAVATATMIAIAFPACATSAATKCTIERVGMKCVPSCAACVKQVHSECKAEFPDAK